jgi:glucose dehydrogenase
MGINMPTSKRLFFLGGFCIAMAGGCFTFCILAGLAFLFVGLLAWNFAIDYAMSFD